ncbi:uncharacterized protein TA18825 [Theileria annulata]|uniref:Uncharacterized protein n=1 Tax=Theileria annulata TaxID=5874 RepID=Q4UBC3_THEAN|nr:uncharacterized protein TA18825 [Theileria annulata]CAI75878.1 hypothetical protein TA18825 [Theileria annulata]|eukprot:XP_955354.1 hypothetical protein TA18825 [Theileria annulata]
MKGFGNFDRVVKVFSSRKILKLNYQLKKILWSNKVLLKESKGRSFDNSLIYCGINNINIISNGLRSQKTTYISKPINILSFYLSISGIVYHIKARVKLNDKTCESRTFYTPSKSSLVLLSTISDKNIILIFLKYFGVDLKNVYDIKHLLLLYSTIDKQMAPEHYSQIIRTHLHQKEGPNLVKLEHSENNLINFEEPCMNMKDSNTIVDQLSLIQKSPSLLVPFARIHNLRSYLYSKYGINNETFNLRFETVYREIKSNPRIYSPVYEKKLDSGTLRPKILEEKLLSSLLNSDKSVKLKLVSKPADLNGIILYRFDGKIILNINSFYVDELEGEIFHLYGLVNEGNFKYFSDKKVGDTVQCAHEDSENIRIKFNDEKPCIPVKRFNQESLVYSLRKCINLMSRAYHGTNQCCEWSRHHQSLTREKYTYSIPKPLPYHSHEPMGFSLLKVL